MMQLRSSPPLGDLRVKSDPSMYLSIYACARACVRVRACVRLAVKHYNTRTDK
jgi:hypothetical protein